MMIYVILVLITRSVKEETNFLQMKDTGEILYLEKTCLNATEKTLVSEDTILIKSTQCNVRKGTEGFCAMTV